MLECIKNINFWELVFFVFIKNFKLDIKLIIKLIVLVFLVFIILNEYM